MQGLFVRSKKNTTPSTGGPSPSSGGGGGSSAYYFLVHVCPVNNDCVPTRKQDLSLVFNQVMQFIRDRPSSNPVNAFRIQSTELGEFSTFCNRFATCQNSTKFKKEYEGKYSICLYDRGQSILEPFLGIHTLNWEYNASTMDTSVFSRAKTKPETAIHSDFVVKHLWAFPKVIRPFDDSKFPKYVMTVSDSETESEEVVKQEKDDTRVGSEDNEDSDECYNMSYSLSGSEKKMQRALSALKSSQAKAAASEEAIVDENGDDEVDENGDTDDVDAGNVDMAQQAETINALLNNKPATPKRKSTQGAPNSSSLLPGADACADADANSSNGQLEASSQSSSRKKTKKGND